ncbi:uncharacterized protein TNCV_4896541 [Trichonephila clavipes]|uniref:DNA-directed DNA polymerase n=1 Tax=Trichonephila clavipes TaxID=2585209 RepID=A0A8X7B9G6_TRICX|nr:uncharacterized protein TNCV_4896541 [Trichonephila clavipes]
MQTYKLDPCWYFTTPALSWDAMLLHTKVAIELFTDYDMLLFIEKGVRGGISQCCNRYATANNRYMSNFNPDDEIKYLMYLDANNLYGYAISKYLPLKDFVWSDNDLTEQDILNLSDESDVGYILEVDLEYPSDLHDKHSDFPLAPENKPPPNCKEPRLLTTLEPKTKYVLHYSNLKLYLKLGMDSAINTQNLIRSFGWEQIDHPPYSPDMAQSDFRLFRYLKEFLGGKRFDTADEVKEVQDWLSSQAADVYELENQSQCRRKTTQLVSRNETTQQEKTTQLGNMNETTQQEKTTQLSSRNEQLNSAAGTKQLNSALPSTAYNAYNRLQPPATAYNRLQPPTTACNRLHRLYSRIGFFYLLSFLLCKF